MSNTLLASYETAAVPVSWQLRFNPQSNTVHPNTIGVPFTQYSFGEGSSPMTIDWGDGTSSVVDENSQLEDFTHTYDTSADDVTVTLTSKTWPSYRYAVESYSDSASSSIIRKQYFDTALISVLDRIPKVAGGYYDGATASFGTDLFNGCNNLVFVPDDVFDNNAANNRISFSSCFNGCSSLTSIPAGLFDNIVNVTSFSSCFNGCSSLTSIPVGLFTNNTQITSFYNCFKGCSSLTSIPAGLFDNNTQVTTFWWCFGGCSSLTSIPDGLFDNNTQVITFAYCFYGTGIISIPVGLFDNNVNVTSFADCFNKCSELKNIPADLFSKNVEVTDFSSCFNDSGVESIPEGLFDNNTKATAFRQCFGFNRLTNVPQNLFAKNINVTDFGRCFVNAYFSDEVTLTIGSPVVDRADNFVFDQLSMTMTVIVPANSTTYDTFTEVAKDLNIVVQTA